MKSCQLHHPRNAGGRNIQSLDENIEQLIHPVHCLHKCVRKQKNEWVKTKYKGFFRTRNTVQPGLVRDHFLLL